MKIALVGAGNMGGAIASGLLDTGFIKASELIVVDPHNQSLAAKGVFVYHSIEDAPLQTADAVILAVKPWIAREAAKKLAELMSDRRMLICSVVANFTLDEMSEIFAGRPVFRIMPNTAVRVGEGMTFVAHRGADEEEVDAVDEMFASLGEVMVIEEVQMGACMALASCGIAYAMRYVRAAMEGGVELGVSSVAAQEIMVQTLRGAAAILADGSHPEAEIDKVTTPGGITIKGLNAMEEHGFTNAVIQGLKASK